MVCGYLYFASYPFRIPECTRVRDRMLYASSFDALKSKLTGFKGFIQVNEVADLTEEHFSQNIPGCRR